MYREVVAEDGTVEERPFHVGDYREILDWCLWLNEIAGRTGQDCRFFVREYGCSA